MNMVKRLVFAFLVAHVGCGSTNSPPVRKVAAPSRMGDHSSAGPGEWTFSGPFTHKNLSIFLVHGPDAIQAGRLRTLQEAMDGKKLVVHETGQVNELAIENLGDEDVFIQGGEIVRGGRQDRMIGTDLIVEAHSGRVPITSFCVEHGRWQQRGRESPVTFSSSNNYAPTNSIRLAAMAYKDQSAVWSAVEATQVQLGRSVAATVVPAESASSLELTLENDRVRREKAAYLESLSAIGANKADVIGAVIVLNGRISSADVYGSHELFRKLWPKLIESSAVEALAAQRGDAAVPTPTIEQVGMFLNESAGEKIGHRVVSRRVATRVHDLPGHMRFDTLDTASKDACVHINCLAREDAAVTVEPYGAKRSQIRGLEQHGDE